MGASLDIGATSPILDPSSKRWITDDDRHSVDALGDIPPAAKTLLLDVVARVRQVLHKEGEICGSGEMLNTNSGKSFAYKIESPSDLLAREEEGGALRERAFQRGANVVTASIPVSLHRNDGGGVDDGVAMIVEIGKQGWSGWAPVSGWGSPGAKPDVFAFIEYDAAEKVDETNYMGLTAPAVTEAWRRRDEGMKLADLEEPWAGHIAVLIEQAVELLPQYGLMATTVLLSQNDLTLRPARFHSLDDRKSMVEAALEKNVSIVFGITDTWLRSKFGVPTRGVRMWVEIGLVGYKVESLVNGWGSPGARMYGPLVVRRYDAVERVMAYANDGMGLTMEAINEPDRRAAQSTHDILDASVIGPEELPDLKDGRGGV